MARRKVLSWPLNFERRELNKNSPPVMWHGVVGADENSFLVVVTSRQKFPYNKFHFLNRMKIATSPSVQNDEECTFQQKKRVKSRT